MESKGQQAELELRWGVHRAARQAPAKLVAQIESDAQALEVSMKAGGCKAAYIAARIGKSEGYVSRLRKGKRPIPAHLVGPLCAATGSNLLQQYRDLQRALDGGCETERLAELLRVAA